MTFLEACQLAQRIIDDRPVLRLHAVGTFGGPEYRWGCSVEHRVTTKKAVIWDPEDLRKAFGDAGTFSVSHPAGPKPPAPYISDLQAREGFLF